jgi:transposase-like protein
MNPRLVTVKTFSSAWEADLAKTQLEACGIHAFILDSNTISVNWLFSNAIGGIKLQVFEDQATEAKEVLSNTAEGLEGSISEDKIKCPQCGSEKVTQINWERRWSLVSILFLGFPIFYPRGKYLCQDCGHKWKERTNKSIRKNKER